MQIEKYIKDKLNNSKDYIIKHYQVSNQNIILVFNETLCNINEINNLVLKEISKYTKKELKNIENILPTIINKITYESIINNLLNGYVILIIKHKLYAIELKKDLSRGINTIESELSITGPKDSFTESINTNIGLIRKRIKSSDLILDNINIGKNTNTNIGILYMKNIVKEELLTNIKNDLEKIDIDGIIDSSYLKKTLEKKNNLFPTLITTERPDKASMALLEGKVIIITDTSPYVIIIPSLFIDFFHTTDDYYQKNINTTFIRIIRLFAFIISIFTPAIYIIVTTRNYDLIPLSLLEVLKAGRTFVPFPAYIEALFMIICFEILKESDLRMSSTSGSAISILGGLILGDAAVSAGIVSPIMIIVIAISSISGLIFTSIELSNALREYKIFFLILSTILGLNGFLISTTILLYNLLTLKIYNIPYLTPLLPYEKNEIKDSFIKLSNNKRNKFLTNNINRGKTK